MGIEKHLNLNKPSTRRIHRGSQIAAAFLSSSHIRGGIKRGISGAARGARQGTSYRRAFNAGKPYRSPTLMKPGSRTISSNYRFHELTLKGELPRKPIIQIAMEMKKHLDAKKAGKVKGDYKPQPLLANNVVKLKRPNFPKQPVQPVAPVQKPAPSFHLHLATTAPKQKPAAKKTKAKAVGDQSYSDIQSEISQAFRNQFPNEPAPASSAPSQPAGIYRYVSDTFPDYVIVCENDEYFKVPYSRKAGGDTEADVSFVPKDKWKAVSRKMTTAWVSKEIAAQQFVFKDAKDEYRWVLLSSNGFRDRDNELITTKALERDVALWELEGKPAQPLRFWHLNLTDDYSRGVELGTTDFRMMHNHTLIESGTFLDPVIGEAVFKAQDQLAASVGFRHSPNEPNSDKMFTAVEIFERSLLPRDKASNPLTHLIVN